MKNKIRVSLGAVALLLSTTVVQASWLGDAWESTKEKASSVWGSISDTAVEVKDDVKDEVKEVRESEETETAIEDVKKLGDKETYINTWEDIKESAKHPKESSNEEAYGIPE